MPGYHNIHGAKVVLPAFVPLSLAQDDLGLSDPQDPDTYKRYCCPECGEHHKTECGAEDCCPRPLPEVVYVLDGVEYDTEGDLLQALNSGAPELICPVCQDKHADAKDAAECCLWKTHGPAQRYSITKAVERGESWADAIAASTQGA